MSANLCVCVCVCVCVHACGQGLRPDVRERLSEFRFRDVYLRLSPGVPARHKAAALGSALWQCADLQCNFVHLSGWVWTHEACQVIKEALPSLQHIKIGMLSDNWTEEEVALGLRMFGSDSKPHVYAVIPRQHPYVSPEMRELLPSMPAAQPANGSL